MQNYKKLINDNATDFNNPDQLIDFLDTYFQEGQEIKDQEDNLNEYADSLVPIYYNDIIEEWKNNQSCHGEAGKQGIIEGLTDAYKIMQADLYCHYFEELYRDYSTLTGLIDNLPEEEETPEK